MGSYGIFQQAIVRIPDSGPMAALAPAQEPPHLPSSLHASDVLHFADAIRHKLCLINVWLPSGRSESSKDT